MKGRLFMHDLRMGMNINDYVRDPVFATQIQPNAKERFSSNRNQTLRNLIGQWAQTRAWTCGQQEGFQGKRSPRK